MPGVHRNNLAMAVSPLPWCFGMSHCSVASKCAPAPAPCAALGGSVPLALGAEAGPIPAALSDVTGWGRMPHVQTTLFSVAGFPAEGRDMR